MSAVNSGSLPLEIEYKFLIRYPDIDILSKQEGYKAQSLTQVYIELPESEGSKGRGRIRRIEDKDGIKYIKTVKTHLTDLTRIEVEHEISKQEYERLLNFRQPDKQPISKVRHSFKSGDFTCEVDVFPFWDDRAYLEIEVTSEYVKPPIPDFIEVLKDVTHDKRYRNSSLAKKIITEVID